ncbi:MAG: FAD-dependent oxidoreductase [Verrucomicrobiota bacterium]
MSSPLPASARVVIIGGGIVGCSIAYHLAKLGWRDVVVLEQNLLAGGTTWHAAGLVGRLRTSTSLTAINKYSAELYQGLERETGHPVGWKQVGSLILGRSEARMTQLKRTMAMAEWFGIESWLISPEEAQLRWPLLRVDDILGAAWLPHDGKVLPKEVAIALAKGAQAGGATLVEGVRVTGIRHRDGRATGVETDQGTITAETVVLTGGMWARDLGLRCGVDLPLYPVEHHYVVSNPVPGAFDELPVGRDPDLCLYFRGEGDSVMLGAFQAESKPWKVDRVPDTFSFQLLEPDWEKFAEPLRHGRHRIPALETSGFQKFVNGPESFTPDNNFLMGETAQMKGLFVACGFNSVGIASAGGAGKYLAEWIVDGQPSLDLWSVDVRRFGPWANNREFLRRRVVEVLGLHYQMAWPNREPETGRDIRRSPLHDRLAARGACFGQKAGWERPNWFARDGAGFAGEPKMDHSFGRQNWFENHAAEHRAAREAVALFDQTAFGKLVVQGADALALMQRLCANDVDVAVGRVVYTGMLNERGGFESDLTVVRIAKDAFYLVTGSTQAVRDADWIRTHIPDGARADVTDVTGAHGVIGVMGPAARTLLARVTEADLSNEAFPFGTARTISVGLATVRAIRLTYVGELGWELHVPAEQMVHVHETLHAAGAGLGVTDAGHYAVNSLRLEKGYRAFGAELSPDESPVEAGLGFAVAWDKPGGFIGRDALLRQRAAGVKKRLAVFTLDDPEPVLWGSEPILRDGVMAGYTTSGSYGHTVGRAVGMGYVREAGGVTDAFLKAGRYEVLVNGIRRPATLHLRCPVDPDRRKILA